MGGSCGIGVVIVKWLVVDGVDVVIMYEKLVEWVQVVVVGIEVLGWCVIVIQVDSVDLVVVWNVVDCVVEVFGGFDIFVNNVGIFWVGLFDYFMFDDIDVMLNVNVCVVIVVLQVVVWYFGEGGCIVLIGSCFVMCVFDVGMSFYVVSKVVLIGWMQGFVCDFGLCGIMVNIVYLGLIDIDMNLVDGVYVDVQCLWMVIQQYGKVDDVVVFVVFVVGLEGWLINGIGLMIDGGVNV